MILIEGIPVVAARLAAEQKAKEWLAKTGRGVSNAATKKTPIDRLSQLSSAARAA
jgi:hypothetical protein